MELVRRIGLGLAAPVLAFVIAAVLSTVLLVSTGADAGKFWDTLLTAPENRNLVNIINGAAVLYLSGIAAAVGFRMGLFNIGVEGQYRIGSFAAALVAGEAWLPGKANTLLAVLVAMVAGALWAGIAGLLRVTRGVSEVIATIMLNAVAGVASRSSTTSPPRSAGSRSSRRSPESPSTSWSTAPPSASTCGRPGSPSPPPWRREST